MEHAPSPAPPPFTGSTDGLHIVLLEPEIPPNTGNIARLCAATRTELHLIEPLGFRLDDTALRRAGMDYWQHVTWHRWPSWQVFDAARPPLSRLWLIEHGGPKRYTQAAFAPGDFLVFGRETAGLPQPLLAAHPEAWLRIPMANRQARSLNLSNCAALVLFEALRQLGFPGDPPTPNACPSPHETLASRAPCENTPPRAVP